VIAPAHTVKAVKIEVDIIRTSNPNVGG